MSTKYRKLLFAVVAVLVVNLGLSSCGSRHTYSARSDYGGAVKGKTEHIKMSSNLTPSARALLSEADSWIGTKYTYGGMDRSGVDCSGFVHQVYKNALNIKLPRNSAKQQEYCNSIRRGDLQVGDLVFFTVRGSSKVGHVGIYIGEDKMIHASSSNGVIITPLDNPYFKSNYFSSGRIHQYHAMVQRERSQSKPSSPNTVSPGAPTRQPSEILQAAADRVTQPKGSVRITKVTPPPATQAAMARNTPAARNATLPTLTTTAVTAPVQSTAVETDDETASDLTVMPDFLD